MGSRREDINVQQPKEDKHTVDEKLMQAGLVENILAALLNMAREN